MDRYESLHTSQSHMYNATSMAAIRDVNWPCGGGSSISKWFGGASSKESCSVKGFGCDQVEGEL